MRDSPRLFWRNLRRSSIMVPSTFVLIAAGVLFLSGSSLAQNGLDSAQLDEIRNYAMTICPAQPLKSKNEVTEWGVRGEAGLTRLLSKLASLSADAEYHSRVEEAEGLLQKDLPKVLKDAIDCRLKVTELLSQAILVINKPLSPTLPKSSKVQGDSQLDESDLRTKISVGRQISMYVKSGTSNNPELNASQRLQRKLEESGYQVRSAQDRGAADIVIEISMGKSDDIDCSAENYGQCLLKIDTYYCAYWREGRKLILTPDIMTESASGIPSTALNRAADKAASDIVSLLNAQLHS